MVKIDTQSRIDFDRSIGTEDRFGLRSWFEKLVETFNQSNPSIWEDMLDDEVYISGFTDLPMGKEQFIEYLMAQFGDGVYTIRYPNLKALFNDGAYILSGSFESFTDGVLATAGDIVVEVIKDDEDKFKLKSQTLSPRFRVQ